MDHNDNDTERGYDINVAIVKMIQSYSSEIIEESRSSKNQKVETYGHTSESLKKIEFLREWSIIVAYNLLCLTTKTCMVLASTEDIQSFGYTEGNKRTQHISYLLFQYPNEICHVM